LHLVLQRVGDPAEQVSYGHHQIQRLGQQRDIEGKRPRYLGESGAAESLRTIHEFSPDERARRENQRTLYISGEKID
jgi:hypothetical protein